MDYRFFECTESPGLFFQILPEDWKTAIIPFWPKYRETTRVFVISISGKVVVGGLVFSTVSPDTMFYKEEAQSWFNNGYLYLAYIWVDEHYRGKGLGSIWLKQIHSFYNKQKFWLAIEDYALLKFYSANGYNLVKEIQGEENAEWILARPVD